MYGIVGIACTNFCVGLVGGHLALRGVFCPRVEWPRGSFYSGGSFYPPTVTV